MSPEKNNMKTKKKNVKKNEMVKVKEHVTYAEEEEGERIKVKKAALKRMESVKAAALEHGHDSPSCASTSKTKATANAEGSTSKQQCPVKNKGATATSASAKAKPHLKVKKASVPMEESTPTTSISTTPTRRNAATQAT